MLFLDIQTQYSSVVLAAFPSSTHQKLNRYYRIYEETSIIISYVSLLPWKLHCFGYSRNQQDVQWSEVQVLCITTVKSSINVSIDSFLFVGKA